MQGKISIASLNTLVSFDHLAEIRSFATVHASQSGLSDAQVDRLELAVVEFVTNVIRHAKGLPDEARIDMVLERDTEAFWCCISYPGDGYTPPRPEDISIHLDEYPEGGFGNFIIHNACDDVTFQYVDGRNITRMKMVFEDTAA
ncbi:MAG: hypothetical protein RLZZ352_2711 [Pseudomonadota bacterium]|jgi:anti-sigma regulatory factor (Ser/Thr protein kinase)